MTDIETRPFSMSYVLCTTAKHMRKSIEISFAKTLARIDEFKDDQAKSSELFRTLAHLNTMKKQLNEFEQQNSEDFKGE